MLVDAAVESFIPTCIYNNVKGEDERWLKAFKEPSWNNPVVRIVDAKHQDLVPRVANDWTLRGITSAMVHSLRKTKRVVPPYLALLAEELSARKRGVETAIFGMA